MRIIAAMAALLTMAACSYLRRTSAVVGLVEGGRGRGRWLTSAQLDFKTVETKEPALGLAVPAGTDDLLLPYHELSHDEEDSICIATVDDGKVLSVAVIEENGRLDMALPKGHEAVAAVQCTSYAENPIGLAGAKRDAPLRYQPPRPCDPKSFRPGYYDKKRGTWHDACTGKASKPAGPSPYRGNGILSTAKCPIMDQRKDLWISFVGDSVHRQIFMGLFCPDVLSSSVYLRWRNRSGGSSMLHGISDGTRQIWLSFSFNFLYHSPPAEYFPLQYTWGEFVRERKWGPHNSRDPPWPPDRVPDTVFYSPGYHASKLNATTYGAVLEGVLATWQATMEENGAPMPALHLMLNMMPAPWMITDKFADDRQHRTLLNEYRKNLAIVAVAARFDAVRSVVDGFSLELPFNGFFGHTAHKDAVHIGDERVLRLAGDRILDTLCQLL